MCGVIGIIGNRLDAKSAGYFNKIFSTFFDQANHLQHRGQDAFGFSYTNGSRVKTIKGAGLITDVIDGKIHKDVIDDQAIALIGHNRYPTKGSNSQTNTQPHYIDTNRGRISIISNGDIPKIDYLKNRLWLEARGVEFLSENDSELILRMLAYFTNGKTDEQNIIKATGQMMKKIKGAFSAILMTKDHVFALRDQWAVKPLTIIKGDNFITITSESCVVPNFHQLNSNDIIEVPAGSIISIDLQRRIAVYNIDSKQKPRHCVFELIYFARPDSKIFESQKQVFTFRYELGKQWIKEISQNNKSLFSKLQKIDFVSAVPDSGVPFSQGIAKALQKDFFTTIIRNPYIHRTFISDNGKTDKAKRKYRILNDTFTKYKNGLWGDDSIVRGTTTKNLIQSIRDAGAESINFAVSAPMLISGCQLGIDLPTRGELIAGELNTEEIRDYLRLDSLYYISLNGLKTVVEKFGFNSKEFCYGCFDKDYGPFDIKFDN